MRPLTLDDVLPLEEFAARRRELFDSHARYLDRYRRVRVGPRLTLVFENRQTLWFRLQEVLRIARLSDHALVQPELDICNRLLPRHGRLQAALLIEVDESRLAEELAPWRTLRGDALRLWVGERAFPGELETCRPEDRCIGTAHWVQFPVDAPGRKLLADSRQPAYFAADHDAYHHQSALLSDEIRQSLFDDLRLSERD
jgi:hypothetical protein